jgi:hypothetical protein
MRKYILVLALLLCGGFSLAAQSRPPEATIFVKPVTGNGSKSDDNNFFYKQLLQEVISQDFSLATAQKGANFTLIGSLARYMLSEKQYALHLELRDNKTGELKVDGDLLYETAEDAKENLPILVSSLLYTIPADIAPEYKPPNDWRDRLLYIGLGGKWTPGFYSGASPSRVPAGFQGGLSLGIHFASFMSLETGVEAQLDGVKAKISGKDQDYFGIIIGVPLLLKLCLKPGTNSMLEPYVGPFFNILPIGNYLKPYFLSMEAGFQYSLKAGPGAIFLDAGGAMDLGRSKVKTVEYSRINLHVGLGYKVGFIQRKEE